jgi:hypothetical protein
LNDRHLLRKEIFGSAQETTFSGNCGDAQSVGKSAKPRVVRGLGQLETDMSNVEVNARTDQHTSEHQIAKIAFHGMFMHS